MIIGMGTCRGIMWSGTGSGAVLIYAKCLDMSVFLAFIAPYWFLCVFNYHDPGVGNKDSPEEKLVSGDR